MYIHLHVNYTLFLPDFNQTWISSTDIRKKLEYQISWKSVQWEPSCSMRTDRHTVKRTNRQTDGQTKMKKLIVAFLQFFKLA